jgi:hypothetical protein
MSKEPQMVGSYSGNSVGLSLQEKTGYVKVRHIWLSSFDSLFLPCLTPPLYISGVR